MCHLLLHPGQKQSCQCHICLTTVLSCTQRCVSIAYNTIYEQCSSVGENALKHKSEGYWSLLT